MILGQCQYLRTREHADSGVLAQLRQDKLSHLFSAGKSTLDWAMNCVMDLRATRLPVAVGKERGGWVAESCPLDDSVHLLAERFRRTMATVALDQNRPGLRHVHLSSLGRFTVVFYFLEYAVRSSPAVMIPELESSFHTTALGISAILGAYYYTYSTMSLVAGAALDHLGAKRTVPVGAAILGIGCLCFSAAAVSAGDVGRLLQGAGSAFAFTGAVYLAAHGFSARYLATAIGVTQCVGMLGGSAGQFAVGTDDRAWIGSTHNLDRFGSHHPRGRRAACTWRRPRNSLDPMRKKEASARS